MAAGRIRIGVVGCGLISQVMHLPYLSELGDRFELVAVCDIAPEVAGGCAERYGVSRVFTRWQDLIAEPLDAVLVATSGDHAPRKTEPAFSTFGNSARGSRTLRIRCSGA